MADKSIHELDEATSVGLTDLLVLEQSNTAKCLSGQNFINQMALMLDAHGGISSISKTSTSGRIDTYTITYADQNTSTFTVTNGEKGDTGDAWYVWIRYAETQPTQDSDILVNPNNWIGIYSGTSSTPPTTYTSYEWFEIKGEKGDQGYPAYVTSQVRYMTSDSGTVIPSAPAESWYDYVPAVQQGYYLWTRTAFTIHNGNGTDSTAVQYSVARMGVDGQGSVSTVNGQSVDAGTQNVTLYGTHIQLSDEDYTTVSAAIADAGKVETVAGVGVTQGTKNVPLNGTNIPTSGSDAQSLKSYIDSGRFTGQQYTLTASGWNSTYKTQSITVQGVSSSSYVVVSPAPASYDMYAASWVRCTQQGTNSLTFACNVIPTSDLSVNIMMV